MFRHFQGCLGYFPGPYLKFLGLFGEGGVFVYGYFWGLVGFQMSSGGIHHSVLFLQIVVYFSPKITLEKKRTTSKMSYKDACG